MTPAYTKDELRKIYGHLSRLMPPGGRPLNAEEAIDVGALLDKTQRLIATAAGEVERGKLVFAWRIPRKLAPTMNEWGYMQGWQKGKVRDGLRGLLTPILEKTPGAVIAPAERMRWVRATRFSTQPKKIDDAAIDAIGGKMPVDILVKLGVVIDDTPKYMKREARVEKTTKGNTHLLVEVFEVAQEEVAAPEPADGLMPDVPVKIGEFVQHVLDATVNAALSVKRRPPRRVGDGGA